ncbi:MAG: oligosaccharide flippase family protein [Vicinamibacteria bacterium]|nr:oligosaccharide flippase family protein [Vicinamibacteria bacterium]
MAPETPRGLRRLATLSLWALLLRIGGALSQLLLALVLARALGAAGSGLFHVASTAARLLAIVGRLGLDGVLMRAISARPTAGAVDRVHRRALGLASLGLGTGAVLLAVFARPVAERVYGHPELYVPLLLGALAVVPMGLLQLEGEALKALGRLTAGSLAQAALAGLGTAVLLLVVPGLRSLAGASLAFLLAVTASFAWAASRYRHAQRSLPADEGPAEIPPLAGPGLPLLGVTLVAQMMSWLDTLVLAAWAPAADVGIYSVATRIAAVTSIVNLALASVFGPQLAAAAAANDAAALRRTARASIALGCTLAAPGFAVLFLAPGAVLALFGVEFEAGAPLLRVLALGYALNPLTGSVGMLLTMSGHERDLMRVSLAAGVLHAALLVVLVPVSGALGAATATAVAVAAVQLGAVAAAHRRVSILMLPWPAR